MKYVTIIGDGMADSPVPELGGSTPLESLNLPAMARVAGGTLGRIRTCPEGLPPGSDVAFLTLMGQRPLTCYTGRSPLEAAGEGVTLEPGEVSMRVNLISEVDGRMASYNGDGVSGEDAYELAASLTRDEAFCRLLREADMRLTPTASFRHVAVTKAESDEPFVLTPAHDITGQKLGEHAPRGQKAALIAAIQRRAGEVLRAHPVNAKREAQGKLPANGIWLWGAGTCVQLENFARRYRVRGFVATAVPLVRGIARLSGLEAPVIPGATGELDTDYEAKVRRAMDALDECDFAMVHIEAPDDMSHIGSLEKKREAIRRVDARVVAPVLDALERRGERFRVLLMPDHYTLLSTKTHDGTPVPYAVYDSEAHGSPRAFCERSCEGLPILEDGDALMRLLFA